MLERSALQHNIAARMSLDEVAAAHELVEQGKLAGNLVLAVA
jgi:NADPH:quinone reductase-like Zn-dependent oxidoreductase